MVLVLTPRPFLMETFLLRYVGSIFSNPFKYAKMVHNKYRAKKDIVLLVLYINRILLKAIFNEGYL